MICMRHTLDLFNVFRDMTTRERAETYFDVLNHLGHNIKQIHHNLSKCAVKPRPLGLRI